eukprot:gene7322-8526_t
MPSKEFSMFPALTSLHTNCTSELLAVSGASTTFNIYDIETQAKYLTFQNVHEQSINVIKFANHSPNLIVSSSFDKSVKLWDIRQSNSKPVYVNNYDELKLMAIFSPDDRYILASGLDNDVHQLHAADGREHIKFDMLKTGSQNNFTRSYYSNQGEYALMGSCDENVVRIYCTSTGRLLRDIEIPKDSMYDEEIFYSIQSLRSDPFTNFSFLIIAAG